MSYMLTLLLYRWMPIALSNVSLWHCLKKIGDIVGQERIKQERKWEENLHDVKE